LAWHRFHDVETYRWRDRYIRSSGALDRPGLGQSLPMMQKVTADEVATNLRALLAAVDIHPPYILVEHSLAASTRKCKGGYAARQ
jgi:pimeloyl-ACP methyl ester carboxylesterase